MLDAQEDAVGGVCVGDRSLQEKFKSFLKTAAQQKRSKMSEILTL